MLCGWGLEALGGYLYSILGQGIYCIYILFLLVVQGRCDIVQIFYSGWATCVVWYEVRVQVERSGLVFVGGMGYDVYFFFS